MTEEKNETPKEETGKSLSMDDVLNRAKDAFDKSQKELRRFSKVGRLHWEATKLQRERSALYQRLGETTYRLLQEDRFDATHVEDFLNEIEGLSKKIEEQRMNLEEARKSDSADKPVSPDSDKA